MNKRIITAVVILAAIFLLCTTAVISTVVIADRVAETAKQLQNSPDNQENLKLFEKQWEKYEKILSLYTRHSEIENITSSVKALDSLICTDRLLFYVECDKIVTAAEHLKNTEIPYIRNIL